MSKQFVKINFSLSDDKALGQQARLRALARDISNQGLSGFSIGKSERPLDGAAGAPRRAPPSAETAGRLYLQTYLEDAESEPLETVTRPDRPDLVPDMRLVASTDVAPLAARSVVFEQTWKSIPVFGARVAVDVEATNRGLVSINGQVAPPPDISPIPALSVQDAGARVMDWGKATLASDTVPTLTWFLANGDTWHLCWHFASIQATPPDGGAGGTSPGEHAHGFCCGPSPRSRSPLYDVFVDAHTGEIVYFFSSAPGLIPILMTGKDVDGLIRDFYGLQTPTGFALQDPLRNIVTYDYSHQDIDANPLPPLPANPIGNPSADFGGSFGAAVSAHHNATKVFDFFNDVLKRDGVDDKGMQLVSVVNVWSSQGGTPPDDWLNAVWWQNRMWYGQVGGRSLARYLDIIAHELTHGVTETTSNLIYRDLPGALNESYSDIFGIIIANWYPNEPEPITNWNWKLGEGLTSSGGPIRDFSDPAAAGQPDHFSMYVPLPQWDDNGGVHRYSGIHNKAVYHLLTGTDAGGNPTFPVRDAALLLYLTLSRLTRMSDFHDSRRTLESVTRAFYVGDPARRQVRLDAIATAFGKVGL